MRTMAYTLFAALLLTSALSRGTEVSEPSLREADRFLLAGLSAPVRTEREARLEEVQRLLQALSARHPAEQADAPAAGRHWLDSTERRLAAQEAAEGLRLRAALADAVARSPLGGIGDALDELQQVVDALRLLATARALGGGDPAALQAMQRTYWSWLEKRAGRALPAASAGGSTPLFDRRVVPGKNGIKVYELVGDPRQLTLRWQEAPRRPISGPLARAAGLVVDLEHEPAPAVLLLEGAKLGQVLSAHRHWLESLAGAVRLVLVEQGDYAATLDAAAKGGLWAARYVPYVLPGKPQPGEGVLRLVEVRGRTELASWPLSHLAGREGQAIEDSINRMVAGLEER